MGVSVTAAVFGPVVPMIKLLRGSINGDYLRFKASQEPFILAREPGTHIRSLRDLAKALGVGIVTPRTRWRLLRSTTRRSRAQSSPR
jgi:hypothetical protein